MLTIWFSNMSRFSLVNVVFLLYNFPLFLTLDEDYYWREYTGTIPGDAIIGGRDINGKNVYIGQAFVKDKGLIVGEIHPGVKEVIAPIYGERKFTSYLKILCGTQENFQWVTANARDLHLLLINKHAVVGGHEEGLGSLNIGRISIEGGVKIGKINAFNTGNALLFYTHDGKEKTVNSYEVLVYQNNKTDLENK